ncbi:MAG TPA: Holliday junction resolvase RuvX [Candidatus Binataceae bacterium]|nr:Holliday junction resolvase RuvX [Candidatus Binataceae bacterium]
MSIAALDLGARRIGIAVTDADGSSAFPLRTITRSRSLGADVAAIRHALGSRHIECLVIGLPVNMDGSEGPMARHARNFATKIAQALGAEVKLHDERLSSFEAEKRLGGEVKRSKMKSAIDAMAAMVILESYLEAERLRAQSAAKAKSTAKSTD